jgi:membrane-associated protease RseP (regulator of RpoE activity)
MKPYQLVLMAAMAAALSGCASGYQQFYKPATNITPEKIAAHRASPPPANPAVERTQGSADPSFMDRYLRRAMIPIGYAKFTSSLQENEQAAIKQGHDVGADLVVIFDPKYVGSTTSNVPITMISPTAYSSTIIPVTIDRSSYGAIYFVKQKTSLGIIYRDLTDDERSRLQTNKGLVARVIIDDSPAYEADMLVGDILTAIDGRTISNGPAFDEMVGSLRGRTVVVRFIRAGQPMEKTIKLNA